MKVCQMPPSSRSMGWAAASQPLKSPMTDTAGALGAQVRKIQPSVPRSSRAGWAPMHRQAPVERPSVKASSSRYRSWGERNSEILFKWFTSLRYKRRKLDEKHKTVEKIAGFS